MPQPSPHPQRIWIVGPCGSGKSTLGQALAKHLDVPYTAMDELHWLPGWVERTEAATQERAEAVAAGDTWVIDGNYTAIRRSLLHRAELLIWLDLPLRVTLPRLVKRCFVRSLGGVDCCNGNRESLRRSFLHRDSILLWALTSHNHRRAALLEDCQRVPHVRLREPQEIERWLRRLPVSV